MLKNYYVGLNVKFEDFSYKGNESNTSIDPTLYFGANGGKYVAFGISQMYDSRNSNTNTTSGLYARLKYAYAPELWEWRSF